MGTSDAFAGPGGKAGLDIAESANAWIDSVSESGGGVGAGTNSDVKPNDLRPDDGEGAAAGNDDTKVVEFPPKLVSGALSQLGSRTLAGGPGLGGGVAAGGSRARRSTDTHGGGGLRRSTASVSGRAGRAGAAAYAYATGDRAGLSEFGLDFDSLQALGDPIEVTRRIVDAACGPLANGSLEEHEERYVAASVAEWVLEQAEAGSPPTPEEIARYSIAAVVAEVLATVINEHLNQRPADIAAVVESELFEAAQVLADKVELSVHGATEAELARAIEGGIEMLKQIYGVSG